MSRETPDALCVAGSPGIGPRLALSKGYFADAVAVDKVLSGRKSTDMVVLVPAVSAAPTAPPTPTPEAGVDALAPWDDNGNGRTTCGDTRAHGVAPVRREYSAQAYMRDADGDGILC